MPSVLWCTLSISHYCCIPSPCLSPSAPAPATITINDDNDEQPQTKKPRLGASHPYNLLTYLIEKVLLKRSSNDDVRVYYKAQLGDPEAAIGECKSLLTDWVLRVYERGVLYDFEEYVNRNYLEL